MSFYGSIYYQMAQSFTKILFKNSGWDISEFLNKQPEDGSREAENRADVFSIDSGNRWIQVEPNTEGCKIWHGAPDAHAPTIVQGLEKSEVPPSSFAVTELVSGDYFKVPVIRYDNAGHILPPTGEATYYRMPVIDIISDITDLQNKTSALDIFTKELEQTVNSNGSQINTINSGLSMLNATIGNFTEVTQKDNITISNVLGDIDNFRTVMENDSLTLSQSILNLKANSENNFSLLQNSIQGLVQTIGLLASNIEDLTTRIEKLEQ